MPGKVNENSETLQRTNENGGYGGYSSVLNSRSILLTNKSNKSAVSKKSNAKL